MNKEPLVTIGIPTIDRPEMLKNAIGSALEQSYRNLQVLVVDNASTTDMRPVVASFSDPRLEFRRHESRLPMGANWNSCLAEARGEFFILLSDDDCLCTDGIRQLVSAFVEGESKGPVGASYGRTEVVDSLGKILWTTSVGPSFEDAFTFTRALFSHRRAIYPCSTLFRTNDLRVLNGYDDARFGGAADVAVALGSAFRRGAVASTGEIVSRYLEHSTNLTGNLRLDDWARWMAEIQRLVTSQPVLAPDQCRTLGRKIRRYTAYFQMDVVGKASLLRGGSVAQALKSALEAGGAGSPEKFYAARLRIAAKLAYLGVQRALRF